MFVLKERVVYPGHGVAQITRIIERKIAGSPPAQFFELTFLNKHMIVLVPISGVMTAGIRHLSTREALEEVLVLLEEPLCPGVSCDQVQMNWNKKNKKIQEEIRTGDLRAISVLYRDLARMVREKRGLSYGEQELLKKTEGLLVEEIAVVYGVSGDQAESILRSRLAAVSAMGGVGYQGAVRCEKKIVV